MLNKVNEALPMEKLSKVVYQTPAAVAIATSVRRLDISVVDC